MCKILILTEGYCGKATANGLCTKALVEGMRQRGIDPYVISCDYEADAIVPDRQTISIHRKQKIVRKQRKSKVLSAWRLLKHILLHTWTPNYDYQLAESILQAAKTVVSDKDIQAIVCMYFPLETVVAGYALKQMFPDKKFIIYEVDSVSDGIAGSNKWGWSVLFSHRRFMGSMYRKADRILILKCHKEKWSQDYKRFEKCMSVTDLPLLCPKESGCRVENKGMGIQFLYAGALDNNYRSPLPMLDILAMVENDVKWKLHFFSKGCENVLQGRALSDDRIAVHGYVGQTELEKAILESDVLLSIGNRISNSLPSKLITYMTYKKPIVHFALQENDICAEYLHKYPLALVVDVNTPKTLSAQRIVSFIKEVQSRIVTFTELRDAFPMNLPSYSIDIILEVIKGWCESGT